MYGGVWKHWWFWVALPVVFVGIRYLDAGLSAYCLRYWKARGESPPPRRYSYRLDAASVVVYAGATVVLAIGLATQRVYAWAAVSAIAACGLAWFALRRARANVIGFGRTRPEDD